MKKAAGVASDGRLERMTSGMEVVMGFKAARMITDLAVRWVAGFAGRGARPAGEVPAHPREFGTVRPCRTPAPQRPATRDQRAATSEQRTATSDQRND